MPKADRKIIFSPVTDYLFLIFPLWIPVLYILSLWGFGSSIGIISFLFLFVIGESHFLGTLFFFTRDNRNYILNRKILFVVIPIILVVINSAVFFTFREWALVLAAIFSGYHVTRQSVGVFKLYGKKNQSFENAIYVASGIFLTIGFLKASDKILIPFSGIQSMISEIRNLILDWYLLYSMCFIVILFLVGLTLKKGNELSKEAKILFFTGALLYLPYVFAPPVVGAMIGVTVHWSQYLTLVTAISLRGKTFKPIVKKLTSVKFLLPLIVILTFLIITAIADYNKQVNLELIDLLIFPLNFQLLHYYFDGLIWRGSDPYLRENVFKKIFVVKSSDANDQSSKL